MKFFLIALMVGAVSRATSSSGSLTPYKAKTVTMKQLTPLEGSLAKYIRNSNKFTQKVQRLLDSSQDPNIFVIAFGNDNSGLFRGPAINRTFNTLFGDGDLPWSSFLFVVPPTEQLLEVAKELEIPSGDKWKVDMDCSAIGQCPGEICFRSTLQHGKTNQLKCNIATRVTELKKRFSSMLDWSPKNIHPSLKGQPAYSHLGMGGNSFGDSDEITLRPLMESFDDIEKRSKKFVHNLLQEMKYKGKVFAVVLAERSFVKAMATAQGAVLPGLATTIHSIVTH